MTRIGWSWLLVVMLVALTSGCDDDGIIAPTIDDTPLSPATIQLVPSAASYRVGDNVAIMVFIQDAANVASVSYHLTYDATVLRYLSSAEGAFMSSDGTATFFLADATAAGNEVVVGLSRAGSGPGASGLGELATFEFLAIGPGDSALAFDAFGVRNPQGKSLPARFTTVSVRVVP